MRGALNTKLRDLLLQRELADGGFQEQPGGVYRPDATAWSIIALAAGGTDNQTINSSRQRLAKEQKEDGRVSITADHPEAFWPTALAALAWQGAAAYNKYQSLAIDFLLKNSGTHSPRHPDSPVSHDSSIPGWPWVENTHSWVEPTALALFVLRLSENINHQRARQAILLLLDRQLPSGGWNYGNTRVFGQELNPLPASTGLALQALTGLVEHAEIERSLVWIERNIVTTRTPISLAWGLLGLSAWNRRPRYAKDLIATAIERQQIFGYYPTTHLSLLLLATMAEGGLFGLMTDWKGQYFG